ncbi:MAG TPA: YIP1 family protein [Anaerolineales bacterium]|jgi:hypothetical protein|nr:YIP1 family protein [Anaerolineales bacterium]
MSLMDRIVGAFMFKREVYADVKKDTTFTPTAWGIVVGVNLINQLVSFLIAGAVATATLGALGGLGDFGGAAAVTGGSLVGAIVAVVIGVVAFAVGAYVIMFVANSMFQAKANFDEIVRTVGLASVWQLVGVLGILILISPAFICLSGVLGLAAAVLGAVSAAIAVKEALGLDWTQTIITIVIAWVAIFVVSAILGSVVAGFTFMSAF